MISGRLGGIVNRLKNFKFKRIILEIAKFLHALYSYKNYFPHRWLQNMVTVNGFQSTEGRSQSSHCPRRGCELNNFKIIWGKFYTIFKQSVCTAIT